ncbi:response regulator transcription factor [Nannocystaceae bacterium ST9]
MRSTWGASTNPQLEPPTTVLIVDDDPAIHDDFLRALAERSGPRTTEIEALLFGAGAPASKAVGHLLEHAYQGREALDVIEAGLRRGRQTMVAFVDMRMPPGWDGIETIERLWQVDPAIQCVVCTAYSDFVWEEAQARLHHNRRLHLLRKPFRTSEVVRLAGVLAGKWQREQAQG